MTETGGVWAAGVEAALPSGDSSVGFLTSVSCASAGNCVAVGDYLDPASGDQGLLLTETDGSWAAGVEAAPPANARTAFPGGPEVVLDSVSCPSAGNCSAVGSYDHSLNTPLGLLLTETGGKWAPGVEATLPANAPATGQTAGLDSVSCASAGNCSGVGGYLDKSGNSQGLLVTQTAGSWSTGVDATLPANAAANQLAGFGSVSCASAGNCDAVGGYRDSSGNSQALLVTETAGSWAAGAEAVLPADAATTNQNAFLNSVSCASAGSCSAVGSYSDGAGGSQGLLLTESGGRWSAGVEAGLPAKASTTNPDPFLTVSCAGAGNCSAVGSFIERSGDYQGLLLTETAGSWETGVEATPPANAAKPLCLVPKLKGKTLKAAKRSIRSRNCTLGRVRHATSRRIKKGRVISQKPRAGKQLKHGAKVNLVVSRGP